MLKRVVYKMFSLLMAFFVLLSTVSFTVEKHYCGDTLIDVAVFSKAWYCGAETETMVMESMEKKKCCHEELLYVKGQDKLKKASYENYQFAQQFYLAKLNYPYIHLLEDLPQQIIPHKDYSQPHLVADIQIWQQVFII